MPTGKVKWFDKSKGYGFIQPDDGGKDAFIHIREVEKSGLDGLAEGQRVSFEMAEGRSGKAAAANIKLAD